jgi:uncharacterized protein
MLDRQTDSRPRGDKVWSPEFVHVLAKPTGAFCNLGCAYCYYLDKEALYPGDHFRMSDDVAEAYVQQTIGMHRTPEVSIAWQGGEPTLMGVGFFRKVMAMEKRHERPGQSILNSIQTNGTLLTDKWCEFLAEHDFLVGISIDGPQPLHDAYRVDKRGGGSFKRVMKGLRLLQKHGVRYNILTTVNRVNGDYPLDVYRFHRDELDADWIQFIPIVERVGATGKPEDMTGHDVSERSVRPEQFGRFLATVFDEWVRNDVGKVFVQTFEAAVANWAGMPTSGLCVFDETCGRGVALEHNGDLYSCDHYVDPDFRLGNITETPLGELVATERQLAFGLVKRDSLPDYCRNCDVLFACRGECPKNRFTTTPDGEPGLNYLCAGYKHFFRYINHPVRLIIDLLRAGHLAEDVMAILSRDDRALAALVAAAGRNDPCPCGSGRKAKHCHGAVRPASSPVPESITPSSPRPRVT